MLEDDVVSLVPQSKPSEAGLPDYLLLSNGPTSMLLDFQDSGAPTPVYWGPRLSSESPETLRGLAAASHTQRVSGGTDVPAVLTLVPQQSERWVDTPGLSGHRQGLDFAPRFDVVSVNADQSSAVIQLSDVGLELYLEIELEVEPSGLLRQRLTLTNDGTEDYTLEQLQMVFPIPESATEILDTTGHHLRERAPQRHDIAMGTHQRESLKGRPGADSTLFMAAGSKGFGFETGLVHAVHLAWSGNFRIGVTRTPSSATFFTVSELLLPGEVILGPGESYSTPWALGAWGKGLNRLSHQFHGYVRGRGSHPQSPLAWLQDPVVMSGEALETIGVRAPVQFPETSTIVKLEEVVDGD